MACENCHCQWGITALLMGIFVFLASCVFWVFCTFILVFGLGIYNSNKEGNWSYTMNWYSWVCFGWSCLGVFLCVVGLFYEICCKKKPFARESAEGVDVETGKVVAPTHYVMIA